MSDADNVEICKESLEAAGRGDLDTLEALLDERFVLNDGASKERIDRETFLAGMAALAEAFPDLDYHPHGFREISDGLVEGQIRLTGTHTEDLDLTALGGPTIPATGQRVELPEEQGRYVVQNGKVLRETIPPTEGGGLPGILEQLGATTSATGPPPEITQQERQEARGPIQPERP